MGKRDNGIGRNRWEATEKQVNYAVGFLENVYMDNDDEPPITLEEAVAYCYDQLIDGQRGRANPAQAIRFEGKPAIMAAIKRAVINSPAIKII